MRDHSSAIATAPIAVDALPDGRTTGEGAPAGPAADSRDGRGTALAALGVLAFSLTFPATVWALDGLGPWTAAAARVTLGALLAAGTLAAARVPPPARRHWPGLAVVALGCVVGFPLLTTLALVTSSTAHAAVVVGLLPLTTACYAALRTGSRPPRAFWLAALAGAGTVVAFTLRESGGSLTTGDLFLFTALLLCAAGYGEGGRLAGELPGWQVISWALVLCLPLAALGTVAAVLAEPVRLTAHTVAGLLWLAVGSQFLGLMVWYRGLARAGVARAGQLQLAQPLLTLGWAVFLLGEQLSPAAPAAAVAVLVCIAVTQRARVGPSAGRRAGRTALESDMRTQTPETGDSGNAGNAGTTDNGNGWEWSLMRANEGDLLLVHGRTVGQHDRIAEIVEVLGTDGEPPYRVRFEDGHETVMSPGPDSVVRHHDRPRTG